MLQPQATEQFWQAARHAKRVLVASHVQPDGDALGSSLAVALCLEALGATVEVINASNVPDYLRFLPTSERIVQAPVLENHDLAVALDVGSLGRLGSAQADFAKIHPLILIDHHVPHETPGDIRIVDTRASATCEILFDLLRNSEVQITPEIATCLLAGIMTDTGSFRYANTSPNTLHQAATLLELGADLQRIADEVYQSKAHEALRLTQIAIERLRLESDARIAISTLPLHVFEELGAREEYTEGIVSELISIRSVQLCALIREAAPGKVRASLRSRGNLSVADIAQRFGGGGHRNAAGCSFDHLETAESQLLEAFRQCLESS